MDYTIPQLEPMKGIFGSQEFNLSEVDSTNNFAATLISDQLCQNGAVIMADYQSKGKGQRGNTWTANKGENLILSLVYMPDNLSVVEQIKLNWCTSLAIVSFLTDYEILATIKWPNDILVEKKKIAGILIENQLIGQRVSSSIIGIGLNVNQLIFELPSATSMKIERKTTFSIYDVKNKLVAKMNDFIGLDFQLLKDEYEKSLFNRSQTALYEDVNGIFEGVILGVNTDGSLNMKRGDEVIVYGMKEITYRIDF